MLGQSILCIPFNLVRGVHSPSEQSTLGMFVTTLHRSKQTILTDGCSSKIYWMLCSWSNRSDKYYPNTDSTDSCHLNAGLIDMFLLVAKEGHNERDILLATSWKTSCFDGCTHTRGEIWMDLEEWDWVVAPIWEQCFSYWYLKMFWRFLKGLALPNQFIYNQLWKMWPFCFCQSAKLLTPIALLLKDHQTRKDRFLRSSRFGTRPLLPRLRTTWQKHILQRPGCASGDSSVFCFEGREGFKEKPLRLTNI